MKSLKAIAVLMLLGATAGCNKQTDMPAAFVASGSADQQSAVNLAPPAGQFSAQNMLPSLFAKGSSNPYFPLVPGTVFRYRNLVKEEGELSVQHITVTVTHDTKTILGVQCMVVHDQVITNGKITEDTYDWYAEDKMGNVWYFGEDTRSFDNGHIDRSGSFEAGKDGALAGIIMLAHPENHVGKCISRSITRTKPKTVQKW